MLVEPGGEFGEGGVVFSTDFLIVGGQETRPDGQVGGDFKKRFGLIPSIAFRPNPGGPVFHKELLR
jgi:hypothetical protein